MESMERTSIINIFFKVYQNDKIKIKVEIKKRKVFIHIKPLNKDTLFQDYCLKPIQIMYWQTGKVNDRNVTNCFSAVGQSGVHNENMTNQA